MGTGTLVTNRAMRGLQAGRHRLDLPLVVAVIAILVFGLTMVYSASWDYSLQEYGDPMYMFARQAQWLALGIGVAAALTLFDYHHWRRMVVPVMGLTIALLIVVLLMNEIRLGAKRSLYQGSYQPSELAKVVTILYLSVWLYAKRQVLHDVALGLVPLGVILGLIGGLVYQQPDLSAAITVMLLGGLLFFLAGGALRQIGLLLLVAVVAGFIVVQVNPTGNVRVGGIRLRLERPDRGVLSRAALLRGDRERRTIRCGHRPGAIQADGAAGAPDRQYLRGRGGRTGPDGRRPAHPDVRRDHLARARDCKAGAGYVGNADGRGAGHLDRTGGEHQHDGDGGTVAVRRQRPAFCELWRFESGFVPGGDRHPAEYLPARRAGAGRRGMESRECEC